MCDVGRSRLLDSSRAAIGEDRVGESPVGGISLATDEPSILESFDDAERRDSEALVITASELILIVCCGLCDRHART